MNLQRIKYQDLEQIPHININKEFKDSFSGSAPAPFIGRFGYPKVNIGILSPQFSGDMTPFDSPRHWSNTKVAVSDVASLRYSLVNSRLQWDIKKPQGRFLEICQEAGMAKTAVEVEVTLKQKPQLHLEPEREISPFGPQAEVQQARLTANTPVETAVEKVVADTDLKAADALQILYQKGLEENALSKILSVGTIGLKQNRKLVPTRWSITATDDTLGKQLLAEIKDFSVGEYQAYFGGGWGNYYLLLFFPEVWSYELFETYLEKDANPWSKQGYKYSTDYEDYAGRKNYAEETAGGYYGCRLPVLEKMQELKRQHACLALRFITPEYNIPLGVWVCREAARRSLQEKPLSFGSEELMLSYAKECIQRKFGFEAGLLFKESKLLKNKKEQKKLSDF